MCSVSAKLVTARHEIIILIRDQVWVDHVYLAIVCFSIMSGALLAIQ